MAQSEAIIIKGLDGTDPLLYAAQKAIGPKQLTEDEARDTADGRTVRRPVSAPQISERPLVPRWLKSVVEKGLLCGLLRWRAKAILYDSRRLAGDCGYEICGTGMIAYPVKFHVNETETYFTGVIN